MTQIRLPRNGISTELLFVRIRDDDSAEVHRIGRWVEETFDVDGGRFYLRFVIAATATIRWGGDNPRAVAWWRCHGGRVLGCDVISSFDLRLQAIHCKLRI